MNLDEFDKLFEEHCFNHDIHTVCMRCTYSCKHKFSKWTGMMPDTEYCDKFIETKLWKTLIDSMED